MTNNTPPALGAVALLHRCADLMDLGYTLPEAVARLYGSTHPAALTAATSAPLVDILTKATGQPLPEDNAAWLTWHTNNLPTVASTLRTSATCLDLLDRHTSQRSQHELLTKPQWALLALAFALLGATLAGPFGVLTTLAWAPLWLAKTRHQRTHPPTSPHDQLLDYFTTQALATGLSATEVAHALTTSPAGDLPYTPTLGHAYGPGSPSAVPTPTPPPHWLPAGSVTAMACFGGLALIAQLLNAALLSR